MTKRIRTTSIEVSHAYFTGNPFEDYKLGQHHAVASMAEVNRFGKFNSTAFVCLIDDQRLRRKQRHLLLPGIMGIRSIINLDYIVYETDLNKYTQAWLALQNNSNEISGSIKRQYNNSLQCSHYIAIWYCLRIGILKDVHNIFLPTSENAVNESTTPFGPHLISVLPETYIPHEEMAKRKFLSRMTVPEPHVKRIYYKWAEKK